jgi:hypothetical protein
VFTVKNECGFPSDKQFGQAFFPAAWSPISIEQPYCQNFGFKILVCQTGNLKSK